MKKTWRILVSMVLMAALCLPMAGLAEGIPGEEILARDYSEHLVIDWPVLEVEQGYDYNHGNACFEWWTSSFNMEMNIIPLSWETFEQNITIWTEAADLPDQVNMWDPFRYDKAKNWAEQGLVKEWPKDWRERYPYLSAVADASPANKHYEEFFGGMYYFFRPIFASNYPADTFVDHTSIYIRTDWAEQAGYDLSRNNETGLMTISEYYAYCKAVKDAGLCEYPSYDASMNLGYLLSKTCEADGCIQQAFYKGADGKYHWGPAEEETGIRKNLRIMNQAYRDGLIYPEFYTVKSEEGQNYFTVTGTAASAYASAAVTNVAARIKEFETNQGMNFWEHCNLYAITDDEGVHHYDPSTNYWTVNFLAPDISDEKLDRILSMMDFGCSKMGVLTRNMGLYGVDWELDADGNPVSLISEEYASVNEKYPNTTGALEGVGALLDDFAMINPLQPKAIRDWLAGSYKARSAVASCRGEEPDWAFLDYSSILLSQASIIYYDEYAYLIAKEGDFDQNYDDWVKEKMVLIQPVLDELNANLAN